MALYLLVKPGRYFLSTDPICGTNGLAPCVGLAINRGGTPWFIAHVECAAQVKKRKDATWDKVAAWVRGHLTNLLHPCEASFRVHLVGAYMSDFSSQAIYDGVAGWVLHSSQLTTHEKWDGFIVRANGTLSGLKHQANNSEGDGDFTIPKNP
jgi:hypothetical protein